MRFLAVVALAALLSACGDPPELLLVEPSVGGTGGGTRISLRGRHLDHVSEVWVNGAPAREVTVVSGEEVTALTPPGAQGSASIEVRGFAGDGALNGGFTYVAGPRLLSVSPTEGSTARGTVFTIMGENLFEGTLAWIGNTPLAEVVVTGATELRGVASAPLSGGPLDVRIEGPNGNSALRSGYLAQQWAEISPDTIDEAGLVRALVRHPATGTLYLDVGGETPRLFRSHDEGETWIPLARPTQFSASLAVLPSAPSSLIIANRHGVHWSEDMGDTWTAAAFPAGESQGHEARLAVSTTGTVYATFGTALYGSIDGARTFASVGRLSQAAWGLTLVQPHSDLMLIGTDSGVSWSGDGGKTFKVSGGISGHVENIVSHPSHPWVWAGTGTGTYVSEDGGRTFAPVDLGIGPVGLHSAVYWPGTPNRWVVGTFRGIVARDEGTGVWTQLADHPINALALAVDSRGDLLAGSWTAGLRRFPRLGGPPVELNRGLGSPHIYSTFVDGTDGRLYIGTGTGRIWSYLPESGEPWRLEGKQDREVYHVAVSHHAHGKSLYVSQNQLWHLDLGLSEAWQSPGSFPSGEGLHVTPSGNTVYAGVEGWVARRDPDGAWTRLPYEGARGTPSKLTTLGGDLYMLAWESGALTLYRLKAGESAWEAVTPSVTLCQQWGWPVIAVLEGAYLAGCGPDLFRFVPGGAAWEPVQGPDLAVSIASHPTDPKVVYVNGNSLWRSSDSGVTWTDVRQNAPPWPGGGVIAIDPVHPERLFMARGAKVYWTASAGY